MSRLLPGNKLLLLLVLALLVFVGAGCGKSIRSVAGVCGDDLQLRQPASEKVKAFARRQGVRYVDAFANVVAYLRQERKLPECYLDKRAAVRRGWRPGDSLWRTAPGHAIGGDRFGNRERRLPRAFNGRYVEADVDYAGRSRGAKRLIFVAAKQGEMPLWLTTDHYRNFIKVPE